jgi:uncharacterized membrane protein
MKLLFKTVSYAIVHIAVATLVAYAITGDWLVAISIGLIEPIVQTGVFAIHDWLWESKKSKNWFHVHFHAAHHH